MRILVTGATGFLGKALLAKLAGHEVFALARRIPAPSAVKSGISWIEVDLGKGLDIAKLPAKMDAIIHLAQSERFREFPAGAADVFAVNVAAPSTLMQWATTSGVSRAVFASTGTVYEPFHGPMHEEAALQPTGYYAASKLAAETLTLAYLPQIAVSQLRVFFLYGPNQSGMMISRLIDTVRQGGTVTLPAIGEGLVMAPTYVDDAAHVFAQVCEEGWRGVWNIAGSEQISFMKLTEAIARIAGQQAVFARSSAAIPKSIVPILDKLSTKVDLSAFTSIESGLKLTMSPATA